MSISPTILLVIVRYLIVSGANWLLAHAVITSLPDGDVLDAVAQIVLGVGLTVAMTSWAALRSTKAFILKRVAAMHDVSSIHTDAPLAATMQAQGVTNVVPTPPAAP